MGFLDGIIAAVSPRRAYEREAWRQSYEALRHYDAAGFGRINSGWSVFNESAELTDRYSRDVIRARARDLERNSDILQAVILAYERNVVGKGYTLRPHTGDDALNRQLEELWKRWCRPRNCDVTGEQSFTQLLRMAEERKRVDGGILFLFRCTAGGLVPFKLQAIEVDELDTARTQPRHKGNRVVGGVEYNGWRRPAGYWIQQYDLEGWRQLESVFIDAKDAYFLKSKRRPSQLREVSDLAHTLTRVRDINEFINAVSVKERVGACLGAFIRKALPAGGLGRQINTSPDGRVDYAGKKLAPGMIMELNPGDSVEIVNPGGAAADAASFMRTQQSLIGAGQGLSFEAVSRDMKGSTYSSARQNAIEDEDTYADDIELLQGMMTEIYERFVISCVLAGRIDPPDFWARKEEYLAHDWIKTPKKWIDPQKESNANKTALQSGQKTYQDICAERGKDWRQAIDETAEVLAYGREHGVDMGGVIFGKDSVVPPEPEGPGQDETESE